VDREALGLRDLDEDPLLVEDRGPDRFFDGSITPTKGAIA
jgi:hypothetical protein